MNPLKSQALGLCLGITTAIGCVLYEKLVAKLSYASIVGILLIEYALFGLTFAFLFFKSDLAKDARSLSEPRLALYAALYILTGITSPLWYYITQKQGVMVSSLYEVKYVVMLAVLYWMFGAHKLTPNLVVGTLLALASIYCISREH